MTLDEILKELATVADEMSRETESIKDGDHIELIRHFNTVSKAYDALSTGKKAINDIYDRLSRDYVPEALRRVGVKTVNVVGVGRVSISNRYSCSMLDKEAGITWLKDHNYAGLVQETINSSTLAAFSKNLLETEGKELPPNLFKTGTTPYTSITKA